MLAAPLIDQLNDLQLQTLRVAVEEWATQLSLEPILVSADGGRLSAQDLASRIPMPRQTATGTAYDYIDDVYADMFALFVQERGYDMVRRSFINVATRR